MRFSMQGERGFLCFGFFFFLLNYGPVLPINKELGDLALLVI